MYLLGINRSVLVLITLVCLTRNEELELDGIPTPRVSVQQGEIEGQYTVSKTKITYLSFEGIPYAQPPVGELRFKDPIPEVLWEGVLDAAGPSDFCMQRSGGNENCLYLNIYVPVIHNLNTTVPVMVFINGAGSNDISSKNSYNPELFIKENIIVVTVNYRLGVFGFLSMDTRDVPGNAGLKDQALALQWIKHNIEYFGGDAGMITVMGENVSGVSVRLLILSPMSREYFNKAILLSGTSYKEYISSNPADCVEQLAEKLSLQFENSGELLYKLQNVSSDKLLEASLSIQPNLVPNLEEESFFPIVESRFRGKRAFLSMTPAEHYRRGDFADIPLIVAYKKEKKMYACKNIDAETLFNGMMRLFTSKWNLTITEQEEVNKNISNYYMEKMDYITDHVQVGMTRIFNDLVNGWRMTKWIKYLSKIKEKPVYFYRFSYTSELLDGFENITCKYYAHSNELVFIFPKENDGVIDYTMDNWIRLKLIKLFSNFAIYGVPVPERTFLLPSQWLPVTKEQLNYMEVGLELTPSVSPDGRRFDFLDQIENDVLIEKNLDSSIMSAMDYPMSFKRTPGNTSYRNSI